jgi:hypothetical protein
MVGTQIREQVRARAGVKCEYCHLLEEHSFLAFQLDHIIAEVHGGPDAISNLAWSCYYCNTLKGTNLAGWLAKQDEVVRLFHPRKDLWTVHFVWQGSSLQPRTTIGEVTIQLLKINSDFAIEVRQWLLDVGETLD